MTSLHKLVIVAILASLAASCVQGTDNARGSKSSITNSTSGPFAETQPWYDNPAEYDLYEVTINEGRESYLWNLADEFYENGEMYPIFAEDNPELGSVESWYQSTTDLYVPPLQPGMTVLYRLPKGTSIPGMEPVSTNDRIAIAGNDSFWSQNWLWLLLALALLGLLLLAPKRLRQYLYRPERVPGPMVEGGLSEANTRDGLVSAGVRQHNASHPDDQISVNDLEFIRGEAFLGTSNGTVEVESRFGSGRYKVILNKDEVWRGILRNRKTGKEETVLALAMCGNAVIRDASKISLEPIGSRQPITGTTVARTVDEVTAQLDHDQGMDAVHSTTVKQEDVGLKPLAIKAIENGRDVHFTWSEATGQLVGFRTVKGSAEAQPSDKEAAPSEKASAT